jgi:nitrate reductase NapAB chaperone NapD
VIVAGVVIETKAGAAPRVAARLLQVPGLELRGGDGDRRLAAVFTGADGASLEALGERLMKGDEEILGLYPTFVGDEDA